MVGDADPSGRSPLAVAFGYASRITSISMNLVIPTALGYWADEKLGTKHLWLFCGLGLGLLAFIWQLMGLVKDLEKQTQNKDIDKDIE